MQTELVSTCPICSGTEFVDFITCQDYTTSKEFFTIQQCKECQLLLTNPRPTPDNIAHYYQSPDYISHGTNSTRLFDRLYTQARSVSLKRKLKLIKKYKEEGNVLDYGCGTGEFLKFMKRNQWNVYGVEPSDIARTKASKLLPKESSIVDRLESLPQTKFDVITLWHVLEHVHQPAQLLAKLKSMLTKDGYIFVAVPNYESYDAQFYRQYWAGYDVPRHLWHFHKDAIRWLFSGQGYELVTTEPMKLDAFYVSLLSEKYMNPGKYHVLSPLRSFIRGLQSNAKAKRSMNYSSLIYIARHA